MRGNQFKLLPAALLLASLLLPAPGVLAQEMAPSSQGSGPTEGITVHGWWTIDVSDPDGGPVSHTEFENALVIGGGDAILAALLTRQESAGTWLVALLSPCVDPLHIVSPCFVGEPSGNFTAPFNNLGVANVSNKVRLQGSATAGLTTNITKVETHLTGCSGAVAPASCPGQEKQENKFTSATLPTPIAVALGQTIDVTVDISFS